MNPRNESAPSLYDFRTKPASAGLRWTRSGCPALAFVVGLLLLGAEAPELGVVPSTEIQPLAEAQSDLSLADVVHRFDERLGGARRNEAYRLGKLVMQLAERHQISPSLILAVIDSESSFRPSVVSKAGAIGLMQLQPETAAFVAYQYHIRAYRDEADLYDPAVNLKLGVAYLAHLRRQFGHSLHYLAAYNLGPTALKHRLDRGNYELGSLDHYVRTIHQRARSFNGARGARSLRLKREEALLSASL